MTDIIRLYHEVHGQPTDATPLLLIHGGGSTLRTNFGALLPLVTPTRQVVAVELQGHGHTASTSRPYTFENSAADVDALLGELGLGPVDVLGFSNGGNVALRLSMSYPGRVRRQIVASSFYRRAGMIDGFWDGMATATLDTMPALYRDADAALHPDPAHQQQLFDLDSGLMKGFVDWPADDLAAVGVPTLIVAADHDVVRPEHSAEMARLIPGARLLIVPSGHGAYLGEEFDSAGDLRPMHATWPLLQAFLDG